MNPKTTIGLVAALLVAVIGVWWATSSDEDAGPKKTDDARQPLFDPPLAAPVRFEVQTGDKTPFVFELVDDKWRMTAPLSGPSQHGIVRGDVLRIKDLETDKAYPKDDPDRPDTSITSLDKPRQTLKLTDKDGNAHVVRFGAEKAFSRLVYLQKDDDETVYLVAANVFTQMKKDMSDYRGKRVTEFNQTDATRVEVAGRRGFTLVKIDNSWVLDAPVKARAAQAKANSVLSGLANMNVQNFVEDDAKNLRIYGLHEPRYVVTVNVEKKTPKPPTTTAGAEGPTQPEFDVESRTIRVAFGETAENRVFARLPDESGGVVFQVAESVLKQVVPELIDLRDKRVTEIATAKAVKVTVTRGARSVTLAKNDGKWQIAASPPQQPQDAEFAAVDDLLKAVRELKATGFEETARPAFGLDTPRATIELTAEGLLEPVRLAVGLETPSKTGVYIRNGRDGLISVVPSSSVEALLVSPQSFRSRDLLRIDRARVSRIEITRGDTTCTVARQDGVWRFAAPIEGSATFVAVDAILADLVGLRGRRVVGGPADAARFGLDRPAIRASITVDPPPQPATTQPESQPVDPPAEPPTIHTLLVTKHTDDKVYAMVEGGPTICEVDAKVFDDLDAELFSTKILSVEPSQATRLAFGGPAPFEFNKTGDKWSLKDEASFQTDVSKITTVLNTLRDLLATRFVRYKDAKVESFGLDSPATVVTVQGGGDDPITLSISGRGPAAGGRYASVSTAADRVFVIKSEDADKLVMTVTDFHKGG